MSVAIFIYRHIYCRYLCPGECIVYDRGEFCNKIMEILNKEFGANIRVISGARPQGNGQAEALVKSLKNKMYALMVQGGSHCIPDVWDETLLYRALQILRSDPSIATGYAPMELPSVNTLKSTYSTLVCFYLIYQPKVLLGRKPVFPIEIQDGDIDLSGTDLTAPLVDALAAAHDAAFGIACKNIKKEQARYARNYDKRYKTNPTKLRVGHRIQV